MKLTVLGSAASEGVPSLFCNCPVCEHARRSPGGPDWRRRTCYLLDEDTLLDFGPDLREQMRLFQVDPLKLRRILLTHSHGDHFDMDVLIRRIKPTFAVNPPELEFYSAAGAQKIVGGEDGSGFSRYSLISCPIQPGEERISADGSLKVFALRATHAPETDPLNYVLTRNGKTLLLANDTGWWCDESWEQVVSYGVPFDCAVIDCHGGLLNPDMCEGKPHFGVNGLLKFRAKLMELGLMTDRTLCVANHFSHHGGCIHADLCRFLEPRGVRVGHDGLRLEF